MHPVIVEKCLSSMQVIVDTREHDTTEARRRWRAFGSPFIRAKLDFGDYSAICKLPDGEGILSLERAVAIERKIDLNELAMCFTSERRRFEAEFERAKAIGAKIYLLVEFGSWENAYSGRYTPNPRARCSQMSPAAMIASIGTWMARYNAQILFCQPDTTGPLIAEILRRELKERLKNV